MIQINENFFGRRDVSQWIFDDESEETNSEEGNPTTGNQSERFDEQTFLLTQIEMKTIVDRPSIEHF